ncbi:MAG: DUF4340 domain-containing protein [Verrucomicrobiales bacterium]|nr:DUF4340 domain-containing protein [Verrucomicrobiales bacterium]
MGQKALIRLLAVFAVFGAVALILKFVDPGRVETVAATTDRSKVFDNLPINDIAHVRIKTHDAELNLKKAEAGWVVAERDGYAADATKIADLLRSVWDLKIVQTPEIGESQFARLNLLDPAKGTEVDKTATVIGFLDASGKESGSLWLGKVAERKTGQASPFGGPGTTEAGRYVRTGEAPTVFLVSETFSNIETAPSGWLKEDFFKIEKLKSIAIQSGTAADDWKLTREDESGDFTLVDAKEKEELDPIKVGSMKNAFSTPRFEDVIIGDEAKEKAPGKTTFVIETFDGFTYTVKIGDKTDLNEYYLTYSVDGKFVEKRTPGEEESDEEKKKLDEEFAANLKKLQDKLAAEKALAGKVFKVRSFVAESLVKKRAELLKTEEAAPGGGAAPGAPPTFTPGATPPGGPVPAVPGLPAGMAPAAPAPAPAAPKAEAPKAEAPKAEAPKAEAPKAEAPKAEAPKAEAPKAEAPKAEAPKAEAPKAEAPKAEAPKAEAPKAEAPKAEAPKAEAPKAEASKAEAPKAQ